ncbi:MAG: LacI family transcriptional regulator [Leadbetterella sp.]|nr:LacI family transcriptional regulator [Leadbetterella sp.]
MEKKNVTIKAIAKELGVSISTVSRALKNNPRIGPHTRRRVMKVAERLNYIPNPIAVNLQRSRTNMLGLVVPTLEQDFFSHIVSGVEQVASENGFHIIISQSNDSMETEKAIIQSYIAAKVDGILVSMAADTHDYSHFVKVQSLGIPLVFYDRVPRNFPSHKVRCEILNGVKEAITFLYNGNKRKIALLNGPSNQQVSDDRLNGYLEAIKDLSLSTSPEYIKTTDLSREDNYRKMSEFIAMGENRPEAIVCFNDYVALDAIKTCQAHSIVPNQDICFVSFANTRHAQYIENKPLASVEQFPVMLGSESARLLLEDIQTSEKLKFREIFVPTQLIVYPG